MRTPIVLLPVLALAGCDLIREGQDILSGLTNPLATQALVLGVVPPDEAEGVPLPSEFQDGVGATVFLADAGDVADLENAPIDGAQVTLEEEPVPAQGQGTYLLEPGTLAYAPGTTWTLQVTVNGDLAEGRIDLPPSPDVAVPQTLAPGDGLSLDLTGQDYDGALVVVVDQNGELVYDNRPEDPSGFYELTRGEPVTVLDVPGDTFSEPGPYLVGVAGIRTSTGRDAVDAMNTALSSLMAGQMVFEPVVVAPAG